MVNMEFGFKRLELEVSAAYEVRRMCNLEPGQELISWSLGFICTFLHSSGRHTRFCLLGPRCPALVSSAHGPHRLCQNRFKGPTS